MYFDLFSGSARLFMGLLAMIPKIVERVLLHVLSSIKWVCQIIHGSAIMIPKLVEVGLPDCLWVCWL